MSTPKMIFNNLAAADLSRSMKFYEAVGCTNNPRFTSERATEQELEFMYGHSFEDPDGHIRENARMEPAAASGGQPVDHIAA